MHYKKEDSGKIRKALDSLNWERLFNKKDIDAHVAVFNETLLNVFRNYVSNKYVTIDDKDSVLFNETTKLKNKAKNNMYNKYIQNERFKGAFLLLETLITKLNELINTTKTL